MIEKLNAPICEIDGKKDHVSILLKSYEDDKLNGCI